MQLPPMNPRNIAIAVAGAVVVLLVASQLILPGIAENKIASDLEDLGPRPEVKVSAFPAVKLIFQKADKVEVDMTLARTRGSAALADELERTNDVDELDVRVQTLRAGPLTVRDARLRKESGGQLVASATVTDADLRKALPSALQFTPVKNQDGNGLLLRGSVDVPILGRIGANARVKAEGGAITAAPEGIPLADQIFKITIFQDPRVLVSSVSAQTRPGGFTLTAGGTVAGG